MKSFWRIQNRLIVQCLFYVGVVMSAIHTPSSQAGNHIKHLGQVVFLETKGWENVLLKTLDGGYLVAGPFGFVARYTKNGDVAWSKVNPMYSGGQLNNKDDYMDAVMLPDDSVLLCGHSERKGIVTNIDKNGKVKFNKVFSPAIKEENSSAEFQRCFFADNQITVFGELHIYREKLDTEHHTWMVTINANGDEKGERLYGQELGGIGHLVNLTRINGGGFIYAGEKVAILGVNGDIKMVWDISQYTPKNEELYWNLVRPVVGDSLKFIGSGYKDEHVELIELNSKFDLKKHSIGIKPVPIYSVKTYGLPNGGFMQFDGDRHDQPTVIWVNEDLKDVETYSFGKSTFLGVVLNVVEDEKPNEYLIARKGGIDNDADQRAGIMIDRFLIK